MNQPSGSSGGFSAKGPWVVLALLVIVLGVIFAKSFQPEQVLFANDGPLGSNAAHFNRFPDSFTGIWNDLVWLGIWASSAVPTVTFVLFWVLKPVGFAKFYAAMTLLLLGLAAWLCAKRLRFHPWICVLVSLAGALNMDFFSNACWGVGPQVICFAWIFLALAALGTSAPRWPQLAMAGFAVGMSIMEGFDVGAILSLFIAAYVVFLSLAGQPVTGPRVAASVGRVALVAICAAFLSMQALGNLISTQIQGVTTGKTDPQAKEANWNFATQWSLPKIETLRLLIPGLHGYGMADMYGIPNKEYGGKHYWGTVGQDPSWERYFSQPAPGADNQSPNGIIRLSGSGFYAGLLVLAGALWAAFQSFQRKGPYTPAERRLIWFWSGAVLLSLLLAYGRHAPFYRLIYSLPYFHTIRNPVKWLHPLEIGLLILFGYGLQAMMSRYLTALARPAKGLADLWKTWGLTATEFEKRWVKFSLVLLGVSIVGWLVYVASRSELLRHLQKVGFEPDIATMIAAFSLKEVGWYVVFLALTVGLLGLLVIGWFTGKRAQWFLPLAGLVLAADLARANVPWMVYYDYVKRYASNPIVDILRVAPQEKRVTLPVVLLNEPVGYFHRVYYLDWLQYLFPYYNIQSIDISQMRGMPEDISIFQRSVGGIPARYWQLTSTRYILGAAGFLDSLNTQFDPGQRRFRIHTAFEVGKPSADSPWVVKTNTAGPLALFEFTGALPRAQLYGRWTEETNDTAVLQRLADPQWDPGSSVFVSTAVGAQPSSATTNATAGTVAYRSYAPKEVVLEAEAQAPAVLLLNDRYDPHWRAWVDGQAVPLLRCNFQMRGVFLTPGKHTVEFRFRPPITGFYVTLAALGVAAALSLWLIAGKIGQGDRQTVA